MRAAILCGSRDLDDSAWAVIDRIMDRFTRNAESEHTIVIHGATRGADRMFAHSASQRLQRGKGALAIESFPADWDTNGRRAGWIRNGQMADRLAILRSEGYDVFVIALTPTVNPTVGTKMMLDIAHRHGFTTVHFAVSTGKVVVKQNVLV